ncbi:MAG: sugar ABC transporter ATP-binding protein [Kiritimatiellia bacterium]|jgi:ribose transport system ATP-binding protein
MNTPTPFLQARGLCKDFPGGRVLDHVSFDLSAGDSLGIVGENGAGKSTLVKILAGIHAATEGELFLDGVPARLGSPAAARRAGIAFVPQEFDLVPELRGYENIFLGHELVNAAGLLDRAAMRERSRAALRQLDAAVDPDAKVGDLGVAARQMVELAKGLVHQCRLLILDEPTTVLSNQEAACLFACLGRLRADGVAILLISHRLADVRAACDRVLVLRDGSPVGLLDTAGIDEAGLAERMVGRPLSDLFPPKADAAPGEPLLEVERLAAKEGFPSDASLVVRAGEIVGLAGLAGAGRTELAETLLGIRPMRSGSVRIGGRPFHPSTPRAALERRLAYLPEDRQGAGVLLDFDVPANVTLASLPRYARPWLRRGPLAARAAWFAREFDIRSRSGNPRVGELSGGNQQKVALAKCADTLPRILIADEPTRGVDVAAKRDIYRFLRKMASQGMACLLISSEMEEMVGLADRVVVMRGGRTVAELRRDEIDEGAIILHATGVRPRE